MPNDWDLYGYLNYGRRFESRSASQGFSGEIVTAPTALPVTVAEAQAYANTTENDSIFTRLIEAVTLESERNVLWRAIVSQRRRLFLDSPLARQIELEPTNSIVSFTRWTDADPAAVIPSADYHVQSTDPGGTTVSRRRSSYWPYAEREFSAYALTYDCGWSVADVPEAIKHMILIAVRDQYQNIKPFSGNGMREADAGVKLKAAMPPEIAKIGSAYAYRQVIGVGR